MRSRNTLAGLVIAALMALPSLGLGVIQQRPPSPLLGPGKAVADAKANLDKARLQLVAIRKRVAAGFESRPNFKAAKDAADAAKSAYDAANRKIATKLEKDPAYVALVAKRDKAQGVLDSISKKDAPSSDDAPKLSDEDIAAAGKERTDAALAIKKMEKEAEENDPSVVAARQKYNDAKTTWEGLQAEVDEALKADPAYPPAQAAVDQAEAQLKQARDSYAAAARAARPPTPPPPTPRR